MLADLYKKEVPLLTGVKCRPCVSVIMPFNPKMNARETIAHSLKVAISTAEHKLYQDFSKDMVEDVLYKLHNVVENLDYNTHSKSIAIYVSQTAEKVYYLDIEVREKIIVNTFFRVKDIVLNKKDEHEFLLLLISGKKEKIFFGNRDKLQLIVSNNVAHIQRDLPEPVSNFTNAANEKEIRLKKFLRYIDNGLSQVIQLYPLPLFVMSTKRTMGYFQKITKHQKHITGFIHGNFDDIPEAMLRKAIEPELKNWQAVKEKHLMRRLEAARDKLELATGIHDVWMQANRLHKQLLVVEKDFYCLAFITPKGEIIFSNKNNADAVITNNAVDEIIEKVLKNGGDVEFVEDLKDYNRIALM